MKILHENSKGIRMIYEEGVRRSNVRVIGGDGHTLQIYRFNNAPFYEHPLLSWKNLDCCGGWAHDKEYLLAAVQNGKKPVAAISSASLPEIPDGDDFEVWYDPAPTTNGSVTWHHMIIAWKGSLAGFFDIDSIVSAYAKQDVDVNKEELSSYFTISLLRLFQNQFWINPVTKAGLIITGLGFGYPIKSTASLLCGY